MGNFVVLISNRGSNLEAMCNAGLIGCISCVISNNPNAMGLEFAKTSGVTTKIIDNKNYISREVFDEELSKTIDLFSPQLIVLAGFMRILSSGFVNKYKNKIINIHPSLLPSFVGANAQKQAFNTRVKVTGATAHYVTDRLDHGPIIAQGIIPVTQHLSPESLASEILRLEHTMYPFVIKKILTGDVEINTDNSVTTQKHDGDNIQLGEFFNYIFY